MDEDAEIAQNTNENDSLKNDSIKEIVFIYDGKEYKRLQDSSYPDIFINEGKDDESVDIKLKDNVFISKANGIVWEGATGTGNSASINAVNIPENGQTIKVKIGNIIAALNIKKRKEFVKIKNCDQYFAPTIENLDVSYDFKTNNSTVKVAKLEVFKNGDSNNPIYIDTTITTLANNNFHWDGKINQGTDKGNYVSVYGSPYTVKISGTFASSSSTLELSDSKIFKVEIESIFLTPNNALSLVKPNKTAVDIDKGIEALVKVKNKQNQGVVTSLPFKINWSFEDPDDDSGKSAIDGNGSLGNDNTPVLNGGKAGTTSIMWKSTVGCHSIINLTTAESDVIVSGQDMGKTKIQFSSSVITGDNYILVVQLKDQTGNIIKEQKTGTWTVRKTVSFSNIYQMAGSFNMTQMMSFNNVDPAFSGDGCTDYSLNATSVTNLSSANSPQFLVPLLPPISLIDAVTGLPDPNTELPTAQESQDYSNGTSAIKAAAKITITAKAQRWFSRNNNNLSRSINAYIQQAQIHTPAIIGALYYHPKLDGDPSTGNTNYYPSGIQINVANGNNTAILVDPDDDWRYVQGFEDNSGNTWLFLNITSTLRQQIVARHEVGHASDHESFGNGDHATQGLMHFSADMVRVPPDGDTDFSDESMNKLRGRK